MLNWIIKIADYGKRPNIPQKPIDIKTLSVGLEPFTDLDGTEKVKLTGAVYLLHVGLQQLGLGGLNRFGFTFKPDQKIWVANKADSVLVVNGLKTQGVNIQNGPATPKPQIPQQQNWLQKAFRTWFLATRKQDAKHVAVSKNNEDGQWDWIDIDDKVGKYPENQIGQFIQRVLGADNNPVSGPDPYKLLEPFKPKQETKNSSSLIPEDKITPEQKNIESAFNHSNQNLMLDALAGTGKTTMLRHLSSFKKPNEKWLYLVFNKKNQIEASTGAKAFAGGIEVKTSHSFLGTVLGRSAELNSIPKTDLWMEKGERTNSILDHMMERDQVFPFQLRFAAMRIIKQLSALAKAYAISPNDPNADAQIAKIIQQYSIDTDLSTETTISNRDWKPQLIEKTLDLLHYCLPGNSSSVPNVDRNSGDPFAGNRDHNDTLWYAAIQSGIKWPKYDVVLADEVQDFNKCQQIMLSKLREAGARIIAVGDENQSIYLFRGSDAQAFPNIRKLISDSGGTALPLSTNYRCGKKIIDYVNEKTVNMQRLPADKRLKAGAKQDGLVTEDILYDDAVAGLGKEWQQNHGRLNDQTSFISRTNKPLMTSALDLMKNNIDFVIAGREFSTELVNHLEKVIGKGRKQINHPIQDLSNKLNDYLSDLEQKWKGKISKADDLREMKDITEALNDVISYLSGMNYKDDRVNMTVRDSVMFIDYLRKRFGGVDTDSAEATEALKKRDQKSFVTLTSAHRSKGLEFGRVFILHNELFPHPKAKTPEELDQENNAKFIAYTRAINELHILVHPQK